MTRWQDDKMTDIAARLVTLPPCHLVRHDDSICYSRRNDPNRDLRDAGLVARSLRERAAPVDRSRIFVGFAAGDRAGSAVRVGSAIATGALAARPRPDILGAGAAGGGAGQGVGADRAVPVGPPRVRRPAGWHRLWLADWVRLLDDREPAVLSALQRRAEWAILGAWGLFRAESRAVQQHGWPRAWRG